MSNLLMAATLRRMDPGAMRAAAGAASSLLRTLGNPQRLLLLCQLSRGEQCVSELEEVLDIHQPTLSQQLGVLRAEGLVQTRREGKNIYYSVNSPEAQAVLAVLYEQFCSQPNRKVRT